MMPLSHLHIDDFCRDSAKALVRLYAKFPQKIILYVEDIAGPDAPDEFGLHSERFMSGFHCLQWLAETDYIRYGQTIRQEAIEDATLTHRCFIYLSGPADFDTALSDEADMQSNFAGNSRLSRRVDVLNDTLQKKSSDQLTQLVLAYMRESHSRR